jgi:hypothetical protein
LVADYWTTALGCAGELPGGAAGDAAVREEGRCVEVVQIAAAEIETVTVPTAIRGPSQGSDAGACLLNGDVSGIALVVLASVDAGGSNSIAKTYP